MIKIRCPKCNGYGEILSFKHIDDGICFECGGSGKITVSEEDRKKEEQAILDAILEKVSRKTGIENKIKELQDRLEGLKDQKEKAENEIEDLCKQYEEIRKEVQ